MYLRSLLEYLIGDEFMPAALLYHHRRITPVLDQRVASFSAREEHRAEEQRKATLLGGRPR